MVTWFTRLFQFHKGTIKTLITPFLQIIFLYFNSIKVQLKLQNWYCARPPNLFQFHKGTIKTKLAILFETCKLFQFHKGTIKTIREVVYLREHCISIP